MYSNSNLARRRGNSGQWLKRGRRHRRLWAPGGGRGKERCACARAFAGRATRKSTSEHASRRRLLSQVYVGLGQATPRHGGCDEKRVLPRSCQKKQKNKTPPAVVENSSGTLANACSDHHLPRFIVIAIHVSDNGLIAVSPQTIDEAWAETTLSQAGIRRPDRGSSEYDQYLWLEETFAGRGE